MEGLEKKYNVNFAASDDETGNIASGGDWVMESDDIDIASTYWNTKVLNNYKETMLGESLWNAGAAAAEYVQTDDFIDNVPGAGMHSPGHVHFPTHLLVYRNVFFLNREVKSFLWTHILDVRL